MATIANLVVKMGADNKKLKRAFSDTLTRGRKLTNDLGKRFIKFSKVAAAAFAALAASASAAFVGIIGEIDKLGKESEKLGIGVDKLHELQMAAKLSGVDVRTFNMGLQRMVRRVAEAAQGLGEARNALKELNIDAAQLVNLSPDKQFKAIAASMSQVANQADRVRLGQKLFDSEAVAVIRTLDQDFNKINKELKQLGVTLNEDDAKAAANFTDQLEWVKTAFKGVMQQAASLLAGPMTSLVVKMKEYIKAQGGVKAIAAEWIAATITGIQKVLSAGEWLMQTFEQIKFGIEILGPATEAVVAKMTAAFSNLYYTLRNTLSAEIEFLMRPFESKRFEKGLKVANEDSSGSNVGILTMSRLQSDATKNRANKTIAAMEAKIMKRRQENAKRQQQIAEQFARWNKPLQSTKESMESTATVARSKALNAGDSTAPKWVRSGNSFVQAQQPMNMGTKSAQAAAQPAPVAPPVNIKLEITTDHEQFVRKLATTSGFAEVVGETIVDATSDAARAVNR